MSIENVSIVLRRISSYSLCTSDSRCRRSTGRICFNRPQTYLFVLTEGDGTHEVLRREVDQFQSSSDVSLRTHVISTHGDDGSVTVFCFNRPQTYLFVLTELILCSGELRWYRTAKFQSSSDVSLRTHHEGRNHPQIPSWDRPVSIVLRRISSYSRRTDSAKRRFIGNPMFVSIVLRRISSYSPGQDNIPSHNRGNGIVSIVLRRISSYSLTNMRPSRRQPQSKFQSSSDVSLRTHRVHDKRNGIFEA